MFGSFPKTTYLCSAFKECPDGGIGRRAGLKHQWIHLHPGSTPGLGTRRKELNICHSNIQFFSSLWMVPSLFPNIHNESGKLYIVISVIRFKETPI